MTNFTEQPFPMCSENYEIDPNTTTGSLNTGRNNNATSTFDPIRNCTKAVNGSDNLYETSFDVMFCEPINSIPLALVSGLVGSAIIIGNVLVILAILKGSSRFHRPMYWLIIHLSCADLIVGIMLLWNYCLAALLDIHNTVTSLMLIFSIWVASECSSIFGFVLLAVDRYIQIFYKTFHRSYVTKVSVSFAIMLSWGLPTVIFVITPLLFGWSCNNSCRCHQSTYMECLPLSTCSQIIPPFNKDFILTVALMLFVSMPFPIVIYSMIFIQVRRKTHMIKHSHRRHDMRLIKTLVVILAVFIVTLGPVGVLMLIDYSSNTRSNSLVDLALYIFVIAFLNSLANPVLYMWRISAIRRSVRQKILYCCFWRKGNDSQASKRDITSLPSEQRSPNPARSNNHYEENVFLSNNNNAPLSNVLCLRHIKKGRYTASRTSTPLSQRSDDHALHEGNRSNRNHHVLEDDGASVPIMLMSREEEDGLENGPTQKSDIEITEL